MSTYLGKVEKQTPLQERPVRDTFYLKGRTHGL